MTYVTMDKRLPDGWYRPARKGRKNHYLVDGILLCGRAITHRVERVRVNMNFCQDCMDRMGWPEASFTGAW